MRRFSYFIQFALIFISFGSIAFGQTQDLPEMERKLIKYEQTFNDRIENTKVFTTIMQNDVNPKYLPEREPVIPLETILIPRSEVVIIDTTDGHMTKNLIIKKDGKEYVPMYVHPESRELYATELGQYQVLNKDVAAPLASHRSMVMWDKNDPAHPQQIKLSLNKKIGDALRILTSGQIERAAAVSYLLKTMDKKALAAKGIHFIDEPLHVYLKSNKTGYTVREMEKFGPGSELVPMFALYSKSNGKNPMLNTMIQKSGMQAKDYVREKIIGPMISHLVELGFSEGLVGDPHEQNVAVRVQNGELKEFYYRDLGGFDINPDLRLANGKGMNFLSPDFEMKHMKFDRADVVGKAYDYLLNSNFFALQKALEKDHPEITKDWVMAQGMKHLSAQIFLRTGVMAESIPQMKAAITNYVKVRAPIRACSKVFSGEAGL